MALKGSVSTKESKYIAGCGLVVDLVADLPRKYDTKTMGDEAAKGFAIKCSVVSVLGAADPSSMPKVGETIEVTIRSGDTRKTIFDDLEKTKEARRFLLEGVTVTQNNTILARWAHGAGSNRSIRAFEIVGVPHVSFENPMPKDGPKSGYLRLNLDGSATGFDVREDDGTWVPRELSFADVVARLKIAVENESAFRVTQRALMPSLSMPVAGQEELEYMMNKFRSEGYTSCVVRTFIPGTTDPSLVEMQLLSWPEDIPANGSLPAKVYEMPSLKETKKFAALRDGIAIAEMEIIPGLDLSLIGNPSDATKSAKHKFVNDLISKGLSDGQKKMYGAQSYGPGIAICAVNDKGQILGLTRLSTRTDGVQYRNLMSIPTPHFLTADKIDFTPKDKVVESTEQVAAA